MIHPEDREERDKQFCVPATHPCPHGRDTKTPHLHKTCLNVNCPERTGGECTANDHLPTKTREEMISELAEQDSHNWREEFDKEFPEIGHKHDEDQESRQGEVCEKDRYWSECAGCAGGHPSFWATVTTSPQWSAWEKEQRRRFSSEKLDGCYDYDECRECGVISAGHFQEFIKFVKDYELQTKA